MRNARKRRAKRVAKKDNAFKGGIERTLGLDRGRLSVKPVSAPPPAPFWWSGRRG